MWGLKGGAWHCAPTEGALLPLCLPCPAYQVPSELLIRLLPIPSLTSPGTVSNLDLGVVGAAEIFLHTQQEVHNDIPSGAAKSLARPLPFSPSRLPTLRTMIAAKIEGKYWGRGRSRHRNYSNVQGSQRGEGGLPTPPIRVSWLRTPTSHPSYTATAAATGRTETCCFRTSLVRDDILAPC